MFFPIYLANFDFHKKTVNWFCVSNKISDTMWLRCCVTICYRYVDMYCKNCDQFLCYRWVVL